MPIEADTAGARDQSVRAALHPLQRGQAASAPIATVTPTDIPLRAISSVGCLSPHVEEKQTQSPAQNVTPLRQSSQSGPELSSASTQQSAGDWGQQHQQPPAAGTEAVEAAQGSGSSRSTSSSTGSGSSSSLQPSQQQPAGDPHRLSPFAAAAAAAAPAGPEAPLQAPPEAASDQLASPAGTSAAAAAGAAALPPQRQPLDPFGARAVEDAAAQQAARLMSLTLAPSSFAPGDGDTGFPDPDDQQYEVGDCVPPSAFAGPAAAADPYTVVDLQVWDADGRQLKYYEEIQIARDGSYGDLFLGFYGDQAVAVKKLKDVGLNEPLAVKQRRLLDEATPHQAVQHPGVVKVLAVCFNPPAIVTELCVCSLSHCILNYWACQQQPQQQPQQPGPQHMLQREQQTQQLQQTQLSWALLVRLLGQVASALAHLHAPDPQPIIIHNDIRAANILLAAAPAGGPTAWQLKICDFGLAVQVAADTAAAAAADAAADDAAAEARIPMHTDALWVAPEVLANHVRCEGYRVTPAADVYALGCVLYEMMVPARPALTFPSAQQRLPGLLGSPPAGLEELFAQCVSREQAHRPSAAAVYEWTSQISV